MTGILQVIVPYVCCRQDLRLRTACQNRTSYHMSRGKGFASQAVHPLSFSIAFLVKSIRKTRHEFTFSILAALWAQPRSTKYCRVLLSSSSTLARHFKATWDKSTVDSGCLSSESSRKA